MTLLYVALVLMSVSIIATAAHLVERYACDAVCNRQWPIAARLHVAIECIYYLRASDGLMLYVGQTVNRERRWEQHVSEGLAKGNWKLFVHQPSSSTVRYCWTYRQTMRVERRRTLSIWLAFACWDALQLEDTPRQIHNVSNTPHDPRRPPKVREYVAAVLFLPFYLLEGWMIPEAQWATPVNVEQFS